jgi:hypothetical protein
VDALCIRCGANDCCEFFELEHSRDKSGTPWDAVRHALSWVVMAISLGVYGRVSKPSKGPRLVGDFL